MSFAHIPREAAIYLADWDEDSAIHIRYKVAIIPAHTRRIFTSNRPFEANFPGDEYGAIKRRFSKIFHVSGPLFRRPTAEVQPWTETGILAFAGGGPKRIRGSNDEHTPQQDHPGIHGLDMPSSEDFGSSLSQGDDHWNELTDSMLADLELL